MRFRNAAAASRRAVGLVSLLLASCSPVLDWRDLRPGESGVSLLLPCKAVPQARSVKLAGQRVKLSLHVCSAGGQTWALAYADLVDPVLVAPALAELLARAADNLGAKPGQPLALNVPGATPHPGALRVALSGHLPDGKAVQEQVAVFVLGTRVFQATALGQTLPPDAVDTFFGSLRAAP